MKDAVEGLILFNLLYMSFVGWFKVKSKNKENDYLFGCLITLVIIDAIIAMLIMALSTVS